MSLIPAIYPTAETQMDTLAGNIYDDMIAFPVIPAGNAAAIRVEAVKRIRKQMERTFQYLILYMKIKGIKTDLDSDAVSGDGAGVDSMGGTHAPGPTNLAVTATVSNVQAKQQTADETTGHIE